MTDTNKRFYITVTIKSEDADYAVMKVTEQELSVIERFVDEINACSNSVTIEVERED